MQKRGRTYSTDSTKSFGSDTSNKGKKKLDKRGANARAEDITHRKLDKPVAPIYRKKPAVLNIDELLDSVIGDVEKMDIDHKPPSNRR